MRTGVVVSVLVLVTIGLAFLIRYGSFNGQHEKTAEVAGKAGSATKNKELTIAERWDVPAVLKEISGLAYISPGRFACIQDETGSVFIYRTGEEQVEKEIPFGKGGDYEDLAIAGNSVFVLESGGKIIEIEGYMGPSPRVKEYPSTLTQFDSEGLWFDQRFNRLLIAVKEGDDEDEGGSDMTRFALVYGFDLKSRQMTREPVFRVPLEEPVVPKEKKKRPQFKPSAIAVHPSTGEIYLLEGVRSRLLILGPDGKPKRLHLFDGKDLKQPEGMTFSPDGGLYVCGEGSKKEPGVIARISGL